MARLGTSNADGTLHVVPVVFANDDKNIYFVVDNKPKTKGKLKRIANIERTGRATLLADSYSENWDELAFALVYTDAVVLGNDKKSLREKSKATTLLKAKYVQYRSGTYFPDNVSNAVVVKMTPARFYIWPKKFAQI